MPVPADGSAGGRGAHGVASYRPPLRTEAPELELHRCNTSEPMPVAATRSGSVGPVSAPSPLTSASLRSRGRPRLELETEVVQEVLGAADHPGAVPNQLQRTCASGLIPLAEPGERIPREPARAPAVMSEPLPAAPSTATVARHRPATIRLRAGKLRGSGGVPGANSETIVPLAPMRRRVPTAEVVRDVDAAAKHRERRPAGRAPRAPPRRCLGRRRSRPSRRRGQARCRGRRPAP